MTTYYLAKRRRIFVSPIIIFAAIGMLDVGWAQDAGEQLFQTTCFACHTIGGGRLVGPDLAGVHELRTQAWLEQFVKSSQTMIKNGDADAIAAAAEYNGIVMPDAVMSAQQIRDVLDYIKVQSAALTSSGADTVAVATSPTPAAAPASPENIEAGQAMFQGTLRFENGGAACNACHDVRYTGVSGGGILAADLTDVSSRLGGVGIKAILSQAPFPVMQAAYADKPLTDDEVVALVAFFEHANADGQNSSAKNYGAQLLTSGVVGAAILFVFFGVIWRGRKMGSVNQEIFDRQVTTSVIEDRPQ